MMVDTKKDINHHFNIYKSVDTFYIKRCIELAQKGIGRTYPNPMVGAVIVHNNKIIGEGYHKKAGEPHICSISTYNFIKKI